MDAGHHKTSKPRAGISTLKSGLPGNIHLTAFTENALAKFLHKVRATPHHHSNADIISGGHKRAEAVLNETN